MFLQIFATSPVLLQLLPHDHCSAEVAEDCRVVSHHHHRCRNCHPHHCFSLWKYHLRFSITTYTSCIYVISSHQLHSFVHKLWDDHDIGDRPGWPGQLLDRLGDVPLLPWFFLYIFLSKGEGNQPLQLPLFALELVLVVAGCCVVHVDPAGFLVSQA